MSTVTTTESAPSDRRAHRPVTTAVAGAFIALCAVVASASIELPEWVVTTEAPRVEWVRSAVIHPLPLALAATGLVIMTRHRWARSAAVVATILAAQAALGGLATIHRFFTVMGLGGFDRERHNLVTVHAYAAVVVISATAAAEPANGWHGLLPSRPTAPGDAVREWFSARSPSAVTAGRRPRGA